MAIRCYECNSGNDQRCADASRLGSLYTNCSTIPGRDRCIRTRGPGGTVYVQAYKLHIVSTRRGFSTSNSLATGLQQTYLCIILTMMSLFLPALVMRACSSSASSFSEGCQINVGNNVESCLCATDYCNGADPSYNSMLLYTAVAVGAYVIGLYR